MKELIVVSVFQVRYVNSKGFYLEQLIISKQGYIPVGCVPPASQPHSNVGIHTTPLLALLHSGVHTTPPACPIACWDTHHLLPAPLHSGIHSPSGQNDRPVGLTTFPKTFSKLRLRAIMSMIYWCSVFYVRNKYRFR